MRYSLLLLLWSLVAVYSQTFPYVSFIGGHPLPNHAYVNLSLVGRDGDVSLRCHTDLSTCCSSAQGIHIGDWIPPGTEDRLPLNTNLSASIFEFRGRQRVNLRRRDNTDMPSGIYRCDIPTNAVHDDENSVRESVYVGLYATGGDINIPYGITFTVDCDLNGTSPQFTLTCISTGGPATNVTWTRDSDTLTEGTETVLDDRITAQYTHTLTVTGSLGGLYTCTVANDKPSEASASFVYEAQPESVTIHPVNATAVRIRWSGQQYLSTTLKYTSYFTATGAMMSHYETVLPPDVTATEVSLDDAVEGYEHNFTLYYNITCDDATFPVTLASFAFDKEYFQIQFGPIDYCLNWGIEKTGRIEAQVQSHITRIIRECCTDCYEFTEAYLRQGLFLCHGNPTTVTYRSTLVNPLPTKNSTQLVSIIQSWVSTSPSFTLDGLLVRVNANCPTCVASLGDDECVSGDTDSGVAIRVHQVLSLCAVRSLGQEICTK